MLHVAKKTSVTRAQSERGVTLPSETRLDRTERQCRPRHSGYLQFVVPTSLGEDRR